MGLSEPYELRQSCTKLAVVHPDRAVHTTRSDFPALRRERHARQLGLVTTEEQGERRRAGAYLPKPGPERSRRDEPSAVEAERGITYDRGVAVDLQLLPVPDTPHDRVVIGTRG